MTRHLRDDLFAAIRGEGKQVLHAHIESYRYLLQLVE
jgi:hypothetical protein